MRHSQGMELDTSSKIPAGYLRFYYMVAMDQVEVRAERREQAQVCLDRSRKAIARSHALLEQLRLREEAEVGCAWRET